MTNLNEYQEIINDLRTQLISEENELKTIAIRKEMFRIGKIMIELKKTKPGWVD